MGKNIFDQFTYLHFATGIIFYYWGLTFKSSLILHTIFEILENSQLGMTLITNYITLWPGGKPFKDSFKNSIGDTLGFIIGWISAYYLDTIGSSLGWYTKHIE